MNFWKWFRQLSPAMQTTMVIATYGLLLAIALDKNAGSNLIAFLQDILAILGVGTILQLARMLKGQRDSSKKEDSSEENDDTDRGK